MGAKKELKLFFDMEFTSLSPDAQPISLGIVSEEFEALIPDGAVKERDLGECMLHLKQHTHFACGKPIPDDLKLKEYSSKSFYAEFTDFSIDRCDKWVKENVVDKLKHYPVVHLPTYDKGYFTLGRLETTDLSNGSGNTEAVIIWLKRWLSQFSDYQIQFVADCGTFDHYHLLQLIGEWDVQKHCALKNVGRCKVIEGKLAQCPMKTWIIAEGDQIDCQALYDLRIGLPKLPDNISPVPIDLNDYIAFKKNMSVWDAFIVDRELVATNDVTKIDDKNKHNALYDAKIIKTIYEKL